MSCEIQPFHIAPNGYLHAGSIISLADTCAGYGCMGNLPEGANSFTTIEMKANFFSTLLDGTMLATATMIHGGHTTQVWDVAVADAASGTALALFRCTQLILNQQTPNLRTMRFNPKRKSRVNVLGVPMAYVDAGKGDPIVFLHGNPTSSYLWRNVIPEVVNLGRCIAPDLIGMGDSAKIAEGPGAYRFSEHRQYLDAFLEVKGIDANVTLVGHDWGGPLAFDWGRRHPGAVKAIVYMETIVMPIQWADWPESAVRAFQGMRSKAGEEMVLDKNFFVERILPASVLNPMADKTMEEYRRPFRDPGESRRPTLTWPREIPIEGEPADVDAIAALNHEWLASSPIPKLFINADPGSILTGRVREVCRGFPNQTEVTVPGVHYIQEDSGPEIGRAIVDFLRSL